MKQQQTKESPFNQHLWDGKTPDKTAELAWAAGFFDGEGWIGVRQSGDRWYPRMSVSQCDRRTLLRFKQAIQGGKVIGPYFSTKHKPVHMWRCNCKAECLRIAESLWPFLSYQKRDQVLRAYSKIAAVGVTT